MPERKFERARKSGFRDARLIIIAAEGTKTERKYFIDLAYDDRCRNPKVHVEILERSSTASAPSHVIAELDKFRRTYRLDSNDELWILIDKDHWTSQMLSDVSTQCQQKGYQLAVSNPCFEIWLLLHLTSLDRFTLAQLDEMLQNEKTNGRTRLEQELLTLWGQYNKSNLDTSDYIPHIEVAIDRAKAHDTNPDQRWTNHLGTRVYRVAQSILRK